MKMTKMLMLIALMVLLTSCLKRNDDPKSKYHAPPIEPREKTLDELALDVCVAGIKNRGDQKPLRLVLDSCGQGLDTFTYQYDEKTGRLMFFCNPVELPGNFPEPSPQKGTATTPPHQERAGGPMITQ